MPPGGRGGRSLRAGHGVGRSRGGAVKLGPGGKSGVACLVRTNLVSTDVVSADFCSLGFRELGLRGLV